jgi:site-specific recombinase XerD
MKSSMAPLVLFFRGSGNYTLARQGTPLYTIQRLMGHKSIKMTERYAHLCPDVQATAVETMLNG